MIESTTSAFVGDGGPSEGAPLDETTNSAVTSSDDGAVPDNVLPGRASNFSSPAPATTGVWGPEQVSNLKRACNIKQHLRRGLLRG
uniref:Uncharacterized protein n=1 Tax=Peronospora matthiolae TaxID=2874970 RepID=A0AAV1U2M5_9STRA